MKISTNTMIFISAPVLVLLALVSAYALHAYAAIGVMFACSILLFWLSNQATVNRVAMITGYSCAFACLILVAGIPSGEIGMKTCPERVANPDSEAKISFFYSPFCPGCFKAEAELGALISSGVDARVEWYDARFCHDDADRYGFTGTPCIAVEKGGQVERACGILGREDIAALLSRSG
jgi:glutaredoxin-related protein